MTRVSVIVAAQPHDVQADGIQIAVEADGDLRLVGNRVFAFAEIPQVLSEIPADDPCGLILVGSQPDIGDTERRWLEERPRLVVLRVEVRADIVRIGLRDPSMKLVLDYLRELVERAGRDPLRRVSHLQLQPPASDQLLDQSQTQRVPLLPRPMLEAAIAWLQAVLRRAGLSLPQDGAPIVTQEALSKDAVALAAAVQRASTQLDRAIASADANNEPLAAIGRRLSLTPQEFRLTLLALAPELDTLYQRCCVDLLGETGRRVGSLGLYAALIGDPVEVRRQLTTSANLARWRLIDCRSDQLLPAADEPLRPDPCVVEWLLGDRNALEHDLRLRKVLRAAPWPGARLIDEGPEIEQTARYLQLLQQPTTRAPRGAYCLLFNGDQTSTWYAVLERAADLLNLRPIRVQASRFASLDSIEIFEISRRLARLARLSHRPLLLDCVDFDATAESEPVLRQVLTEIAASKCRAGIICTNVSRIIGLVGNRPAEIVPDSCLPQLARRRALHSAVRHLSLDLTQQLLEALEQQFPLQADGWERAMNLTKARRTPNEARAQLTQKFVSACRDVAAETLSNLATRLDPHCQLENIVLPEECKQQLVQIVDSVRFARHVLDEWQFGEQLSYGRGVTALFHGVSGTGKTMSALAVANELGSQVLRIDLARVVSKYIGETEKHLDAVFRDAARCGAVLLVDEADALLGRRSAVRDAHDRYANIEVSFLLQRIESYDGVAIFTTNARQNLDSAFLRRLRFMIEFPRPDLAARAQIWRNCLPAASHVLDDAAFRQLARKIDVTGGHIRQITLQAAFIAAAANERISLKHIAQASRAELAKLGLPPVVIDVTPKSEAA